MKKIHKTPFALAMGASLLPLAANVAQAETNPFALTELDSAYMQTAEAKTDQGSDGKMKDGSCGEGKCGAAMKQGSASDKKAVEGKCAGNKPASGAATDNSKKADSNPASNK